MRNLLIILSLAFVSCSTFRMASPENSKSKYEELVKFIELNDKRSALDVVRSMEGYGNFPHQHKRGIKFKDINGNVQDILHNDYKNLVRLAFGIDLCLDSRSKNELKSCLNGLSKDGVLPIYTNTMTTERDNSNIAVGHAYKWVCGKVVFRTNMDGSVDEVSGFPITNFVLRSELTLLWPKILKIRKSNSCR